MLLECRMIVQRFGHQNIQIIPLVRPGVIRCRIPSHAEGVLREVDFSLGTLRSSGGGLW